MDEGLDNLVLSRKSSDMYCSSIVVDKRVLYARSNLLGLVSINTHSGGDLRCTSMQAVSSATAGVYHSMKLQPQVALLDVASERRVE